MQKLITVPIPKGRVNSQFDGVDAKVLIALLEGALTAKRWTDINGRTRQDPVRVNVTEAGLGVFGA